MWPNLLPLIAGPSWHCSLDKAAAGASLCEGGLRRQLKWTRNKTGPWGRAERKAVWGRRKESNQTHSRQKEGVKGTTEKRNRVRIYREGKEGTKTREKTARRKSVGTFLSSLDSQG